MDNDDNVPAAASVIVRAARLEDRARVQAIAARGMREFGIEPDFTNLDRDLGLFGEHHETAAAQLVAELSGEVIGSLVLAWKSERILKLSGFYVDPSSRGKGAGLALLRRAIAVGRRLGCSGIYIETWGKMTAAVRLYTLLGWKRSERLHASTGAEWSYVLDLRQTSSVWPYPRIVAHRGGGKRAPENTMASMRCGLAHGFHAVEFDVMLSKDGVPVLMHDPLFGRTVAGSKRVSDCTAQELAAMDAGSWFGAQFAGEPVPRYEDVVAFCKANDIWMNVEIKPAPGFERETGEVVATSTRRLYAAEIEAVKAGASPALLPLFSSFSFDAVAAARDAAPDIPRGFLVNAIPADWHARLDALGAVALHANHLNLSSTQVQAVKQAGFGLLCYTVNDVSRAREILAWGVDGFCTDRIDLIGPEFS
jgi:glycerophosphoryl diester phosphodiesterase